MDILTLSPGNGVPYYLAVGVMFIVSLIRLVLYKSNRPWTNKIGGAKVWIALAAIVSVVMCVVLKINIIKDLLPDLGGIGSLKFTGLTGYIASGLAISLSSNIAAWAASLPSKLAIKDLKEGTPVPGSVVTPLVEEEPIKEPPVVEEPPKVEEPKTYKTRFFIPWISKDRPKLLLLERNDGEKRLLVISDEEERDIQEAWAKISNLEV